MKPKIINNFLPEVLHNRIQQYVYEQPFYIVKNISGEKNIERNIPGVNIVDNQLGLSSLIYDGQAGVVDKERFETYALILDVATQKFEVELNKIFRIRVGVGIDMGTPGSHLPHTDFDFEHYTLLYYIDGCDGDTIFYDQIKDGSYVDTFTIQMKNKPTANQAVLFNGLQYHSSSNPENALLRPAVNINFR